MFFITLRVLFSGDEITLAVEIEEEERISQAGRRDFKGKWGN